MADGDLIAREQVNLSQALALVVSRMYYPEVVSETVVEKITYISDGLKINGYLARPRLEGVYPVLIWNRGGTGDRGALDELRASLILASTAHWGYVVLATQYRGNMGSEGQEEWGCNDVRDSLNLLPVAEQIPQSDMTRLAIEGASRGGMSTYCALKQSDRFRCAIVHAGIADVFSLMEGSQKFRSFLEDKLAHLGLEEQQRALADRSAVYFADQLPRSTPILLLHGSQDKVVPLVQTERMARELERIGIRHQVTILDGGGHHAHKDGSYREMDQHRRQWLGQWLK